MTIKKPQILLAVLLTLAITIATTQVYAVSSTPNWSLHEADTTTLTTSCGTNLTDGNDYSCATSNSNGEMRLLAKVAHGGPGFVENPEAIMNADKGILSTNVGNSPQLTTSKSLVTFESKWHIKGTIDEEHPVRSTTFAKYGHEIYRQNWFGGWDMINGSCAEMKLDDFNGKETVSCKIKNSGNNTYRMGGFATVVASNMWPNAGTAYADFYSNNGHIQLTKLSITD